MAATPSTMVDLGTACPDFTLPDTTEPGRTVSLSDSADAPALVVAFLCNHCPFVKHIQKEFVNLARDYQPRGVAFVAISANDAEKYPDDAPDKMTAEAKRAGYSFPYLYDETQKVAKAFGAACTPDFFVYNAKRRLYYRGQFDASRPGNNLPVNGRDLRTALDALLEGKPGPEKQWPSVGCNIKWKEGNEPDYFG